METDNKSNNNVMSVSKVIVPKKKEIKRPPLKHSNWLITINSQKNMMNLSKEDYDNTFNHFSKVIDTFFNEKISDFVILSGSKTGEKFGLPITDTKEKLMERIEEAKCQYVIEIGEQSFKLHSHGMICLAKRALDSKLDYIKIKSYLENALGYVIHFNAQLFRDSKKNLENYLSKAPVV